MLAFAMASAAPQLGGLIGGLASGLNQALNSLQPGYGQIVGGYGQPGYGGLGQQGYGGAGFGGAVTEILCYFFTRIKFQNFILFV